MLTPDLLSYTDLLGRGHHQHRPGFHGLRLEATRLGLDSKAVNSWAQGLDGHTGLVYPGDPPH